MREIIAFNWPKLAGALATIAAAVAVAGRAQGAIAGAAVAGGAVATYFLVSSLGVSWWVYDHSDLHEWQWLRPLLPEGGKWAHVHAGFDDSGPGLPVAIGAPADVVDISPLLGPISASLRRARRRHPASRSAGSLAALATSSCDAVVLLFAAHEVRDRGQRAALFADLRRVVKASGRVVLVEHLRDGANIAAFGPGAWHFQTRGEWLRLARGSGFGAIQETQMTAFVRGWSLCPC